MMGQEGLNVNLHLIRPSFEAFRCNGFTFKIGYRAVVQTPESQDGHSIEVEKSATKEKSVKEKKKEKRQMNTEKKSSDEGMNLE